MNEDHIDNMINQEEEAEEDKLNTFKNMISEFIDDNCMVKVGTANQNEGEVEVEILFDETDGGKILENNIKTLFNDIRLL